jgi:hypothetical protein
MPAYPTPWRFSVGFGTDGRPGEVAMGRPLYK